MTTDNLLSYFWQIDCEQWSRADMLAYRWQLSLTNTFNILEEGIKLGCIEQAVRDSNDGLSSNIYWRLIKYSSEKQQAIVEGFQIWLENVAADDFASYKSKRGAL